MSEPQIDAERVDIADTAELADSVSITGIGGAMQELVIGDYTRLDEDVRVRAECLVLGDHCRIHRNTTVYGYAGCTVGHNLWCGERAVLNCTEELTVGDNVVLSAGSSVWTHFAGGCRLAGCRFDSAGPVRIGDDAWIGVDATVGQSDLGEQALVTAGSVVTDDVPANRIYGGNPAEDITEKLGGPPFSDPSPEQRLELMEELLRELDPGEFDWSEFSFRAGDGHYRFDPQRGQLLPAAGESGYRFDLDERSYRKTGDAPEAELIRALFPRAKFVPAED